MIRVCFAVFFFFFCIWRGQVSSKHDIIFMITKMGYLFMFDIQSGKALYRAKISEQTIFVTTTQAC